MVANAEAEPPSAPVFGAPSTDPFVHEQRYLLTRLQVSRFFSEVGRRAVLETYDRARPISFTRTTYFDNDALDFYRSCEETVARRLRVREYAVAASRDDAPVLSPIASIELKQNAGDKRSKVRLPASPELLRRLIERRGQPDSALVAQASPQALAIISAELGAPTVAPRLTTWYRRACFTGEAGRVRITLDEHLKFCRPQSVTSIGTEIGTEVAPDAKAVVAAGPPRILEIKYWGEMPSWLARALDGLRPAPGFSKFRMGMIALGQRLGWPPPPRLPTPVTTLFTLSDLG
jgi:hypothetical protein